MNVLQTVVATGDAAGTTIAGTINSVGAGNGLVIGVKFEVGAATTVTLNDGTNTFQSVPMISLGTSIHWQMFYVESTAGGNFTITATLGASRSWRAIVIHETDGDIELVDDIGATGSGLTASGGNLVTTDGNGLVVACAWAFNGSTLSNYQVNGNAADGSTQVHGGYGRTWWEAYATGFTGAATATMGSSGQWIVASIAVQEPAATDPTVIPTGQSIALSQGTPTIVADRNPTVIPSGLAVSFTQGTIAVSIDGEDTVVNLTGQAITFTQGTFTTRADVTWGPEGQTLTISQGTPTVGVTDATPSIAGQAITLVQGTPVVTISGVTVFPIGLRITIEQGVLFNTGNYGLRRRRERR